MLFRLVVTMSEKQEMILKKWNKIIFFSFSFFCLLGNADIKRRRQIRTEEKLETSYLGLHT